MPHFCKEISCPCILLCSCYVIHRIANGYYYAERWMCMSGLEISHCGVPSSAAHSHFRRHNECAHVRMAMIAENTATNRTHMRHVPLARVHCLLSYECVRFHCSSVCGHFWCGTVCARVRITHTNNDLANMPDDMSVHSITNKP